MRGQYRGYLDEEGVEAGSDTETFAAVRFEIDSWRWAGCPVAGPHRQGAGHHRHRGRRRLQRAAPPAVRRPRARRSPGPNHLRFRLGKHDGVTLQLHAKKPGDGLVPEPVDLEVSYAEALGPARRRTSACSRTPWTATPAASAASDGVDEQWRIVDAACTSTTRVHLYAAGSWGPREAERLAADVRRLASNRRPPSTTEGDASGSGSGTRFTMAAAAA